MHCHNDFYKSELAAVAIIKRSKNPIPIYVREAVMATGVLFAYLNQWYISAALYTIKIINMTKSNMKSNGALIIYI